MKLHLTKSLRVALLACVCGCVAVTTQAMAENLNVPASGDGSDIQISDPSSYEAIEVAGKLTLAASGDITTGNTITLSGGTLQLNNTWGDRSSTNNRGTVSVNGSGTLQGDNVAYYGAVSGDGNVTIAGTGGTGLYVYGSVSNDGAVELKNSAHLGGNWGMQAGDLNATTVTNTGDINITAGTAYFDEGTTIKNSGAINISQGATLWVHSGSSVKLGEAINNAGTLSVNGGTLDATSFFADLTAVTGEVHSLGTSGFKGTGDSYTIVSGGGVISGSAFVKVDDANTYALTSKGTVVLNFAASESDTTFYVNDDLSVSGDGIAGASSVAVSAGKTLTFTGGNSDLSTNVTLASGATLYTLNKSAMSSATITLQGDATVKGSESSLYAGVVTAEGTTANLTLERGNGVFYISSEINNAGTLTFKGDINVKKQDNGAGNIASKVTDVSIATGQTTFESGTTLNNNGTLSIAGGATLQINSGATVNLNNVIQNAGTLILNGATLNLAESALAQMDGTVTEGHTHGTYGFKATETVYDLADGEGATTLTGGTSYVKIGGASYELFEDAKFGISSDVDYSVYYANADHTISQSDLDAVTDKIVVAAGSALKVDYTTVNKDVELAAGSMLNLESSGVADGTLITIANDGTDANASIIRGWQAPMAGDVDGTGTLKLLVNHSGLAITGAINTTGRVLASYDSTIADTSGDNTLIFKSGSSIGENAHLVVDNNSKVSIEAGSNVVMNGMSFVRAGGSIDVQSGATLTVNTTAEIGTDASNLAYLNLNGNASVVGTGSIGFKGGKLVASGTGNVVEVDIAQVYNTNIEVGESSALTIKGKVTSNASGATLVKTGAGSLTLDGSIADGYIIDHQGGTIDISNGVANSITLKMNGADYVLNVSDGSTVSLAAASSVESGTITVGSGSTLDLSNTLTLGDATLNLLDGSTIIVGQYFGEDGHTITLGDLSITGKITIDLSSWCSSSEMQDWEDLFVKSNGTFEQSYYDITVKYSDGVVYTQSYLTPSPDGTALQLVPEPTTATLSLLALAGLAARRRRK